MKPKIERTGTETIHNVISGLVKRAFDVVVALFGLILLSPIFILIAVLIKRDTPGPVFYWGPRIGRKGVVFKMLKFRTMYEDQRSYRGPRITGKEDDRITPVGKWLRDIKLNELPQLWNVLIGQMSLVGPRPEDPSIAKTWPITIARELLSVMPGITSPASVVYRDEESMLHAGEVMRKYLHELSPDKMRLDQLYVHYRSFLLDLDVLLWTALLQIPRIRAYSPPEQLLFVGPVTRIIQRYVGWFVWDFLVAFVSISLTTTVVRLFGPLDLGWFRAIGMAIGYSMLFSIVGMPLNTNNIKWPKATFWESGRLWASWFIATAIAVSTYRYLGLLTLRVYGVILSASVLSIAGFTFGRYRDRLVSGFWSRLMSRRRDSRIPRERVLIVGSGRTAEHIAWLMDHPTYSGMFQVVGFIDDDLRSHGMKIYGAKVIGQIKDIRKIAVDHDIGLIILADHQLAPRKYKEFRDIASSSPARVVVAPDVFGSLSGLNGATSRNGAEENFKDFQCQYCVVRYKRHPARSQRTHTVAP
jgi:lipopolysaccharide/colanic/teichoic acid biosynthesis glycosyltransferase